jgi:2-oxoglutarate ferredoxin oxidoreductase subunit delta
MKRYEQGEFFLEIEPRRCKGCGVCVQSCPKGVLVLNAEGKADAKEIAQCIFCGICEQRCPDFAISVHKKHSHPHPRPLSPMRERGEGVRGLV